MANSYYLYQKYQQIAGQSPTPVYPEEYSVDGDGTKQLVLKQANDPNCNITPPEEPIYRWVALPINEGYICDDCYAAIVNNGERLVNCKSELHWSDVTGKHETRVEYAERITSVTIGNCVSYLSPCCGDPPLVGTFMDMRFSAITIPNSIVEIGYACFSYCYNLKNIDIPDSVETIGKEGFFYCSGMTSVTFGTGVTSIGRECFNYCTSLTTLTFKSSTPPTIGDFAFSRTNLQSVYVPSSAVSDYQAIFGNIVYPIT